MEHGAPKPTLSVIQVTNNTEQFSENSMGTQNLPHLPFICIVNYYCQKRAVRPGFKREKKKYKNKTESKKSALVLVKMMEGYISCPVL